MNSQLKYTEEELVSGLKAKDKNAFSYLYDNYSSVLFGTVSRIVADKEIANDILQEAFVRIWQNLDKYDSTKGRLFTWMLNVTRNHAIDVVRSKGYRQQKMILGDDKIVYSSAEDNSGPGKIDNANLAKEIRSLDENQQRVLHLAYFMGYTQEEISKELNIPLGTVKSRVRSAILELRKKINITEWM